MRAVALVCGRSVEEIESGKLSPDDIRAIAHYNEIHEPKEKVWDYGIEQITGKSYGWILKHDKTGSLTHF